MGQERTWTYCSQKYYSISQALVDCYSKTCIICLKENSCYRACQGEQGANKFRTFRERYQFDLVDFCKLRKKDPFGVLMHWILVIKDHAAGFFYIFALSRKQTDLVAYNLQEMFDVIGYPKIMHSDNGKEFKAKIVRELLHKFNPNILSVYRRPWHPQGQDSVESMNKFMKRNIGAILSERKMMSENPN